MTARYDTDRQLEALRSMLERAGYLDPGINQSPEGALSEALEDAKAAERLRRDLVRAQADLMELRAERAR